jgi:hypothetical protein
MFPWLNILHHSMRGVHSHSVRFLIMNCEEFQYRSNADGATDSICLRCSLTAGSYLASVLTSQNNRSASLPIRILWMSSARDIDSLSGGAASWVFRLNKLHKSFRRSMMLRCSVH